MDRINEILQSKSSKVLNMMRMLEDDGEIKNIFSLENVKVEFNSLPCLLDDKGSFFVLTGNKNKPQGISSETPPDLIYIYNNIHGIFLDRDLIMKIIIENRSSLRVGINNEYNAMGVWLNLGVISSYLDEDFLKLSSQFS